MSAPKRHHYVPQFHLRRFANKEGLVWVYDKDSGECRPQTPENTTVASRFYSYFRTDGSYTNEIECSLAQVESQAAAVIERWDEPGYRPTREEIGFMAQFLALMHTRVPRNIEAAKEFIKISAIEMAKIAGESRDLVEAVLKKHPPSPTNPITVEEMMENLRKVEERFEVVVDPKSALRQSLAATPAVAVQLINLNWSLCKAPREQQFITSDSPLCAFAPTATGILFGAGFGLPQIEISCPISPTTCVLIGRRHTQTRIALSAEKVGILNKRMAAHAERFVISNNRDKRTREITKRTSFTRELPKLDRTIIGPQMASRIRSSLHRGKHEGSE